MADLLQTTNASKMNKSEGFQKERLSVPMVLVHVFMILLAALFIVPLVLPFLFAFKTRLEFAYHPWALPEKINFDNFVWAWNSVKIGRAMINSLIVCFGAIILTVPFSAMAGYAFSKFRTKVTDVLFYLVMSGFFIPVQMVLIPLVRINTGLKLINTLPGVILPIAAFGIPFWTMIFRAFFNKIPNDFVEAAKIDGSGNWHTFTMIMLPLAKPVLFMSALLTFFGAWSDFLLSFIFINNPDLFTVQLKVQSLMATTGNNYFPQYAAALLISVAPTVLLYLVFHRQIMQGAMLGGALKG
mgnify:CR=1 FL=1